MRFYLYAGVMMVLSLAACEGPVGPQGDEGPAGPQGPEGNANVITRTLTYDESDVVVQGDTVAVVRFGVAEISDDVYDSGTVQAFYDRGDFGWMALPWTITGSFDTHELTYAYAPDSLFLIFTSSDAFFGAEDVPVGTLKAVIIPPAEAGKTGSTSEAHRIEHFGKVFGR